jgi:hypothetical protein
LSRASNLTAFTAPCYSELSRSRSDLNGTKFLGSGKILRRILKAKEAGVDAGDVSTMES